MPRFAKALTNMIAGVLTARSYNMTRAAFILVALSFFAKVLGLVRDRFLATTFGAGDTLDVYFAAFRIPDLLFNLFALGAVSAGFLPVFAERYKKDPRDAWRMVGNFMAILVFFLAGAGAILWLLAPFIIPLVAPGFDAEKIDRVVAATRLLLLSPLLLGVSSVLSGSIQHFGRFLSYALAPLVYNAGIIFGIFLFAETHAERGIVFGVLVGALLHFAVQVPAAMRSGFRFSFSLRPVHEGVWKMLRLSVPRTANLVVNQVTLTAVVAITSTIAAGSITIFQLAENMRALPVDLIGISFALAAFPVLTRAVLSSREEFSQILMRTLLRILYIVVPSSVLIYVLRAQTVRLLYGAGLFSWDDTRLTAAAVATFSLGIAAYAILPLLIRGFFALKDTVTPFLISLLASFLTVGAAFLGVAWLRGDTVTALWVKDFLRVADVPGAEIVAVPLAVSIAAIVQAGTLVIALRMVSALNTRIFLQGLFRIAGASLAAGIAAWLSLRFFGSSVQTDTFFKVLAHGAAGGFVGSAVYLLITFLLRFPELSDLFNNLKKPATVK